MRVLQPPDCAVNMDLDMATSIPKLPPLPPVGLSRPAVQKWHELLPRLQRLGLTDPEHYDMLGLYVDAYATWREAREKLDEHGSTIENRAGIFPSPWVTIRDQASARMLETGHRLGLDPHNPIPSRLPLFTEWALDLDDDDDAELPAEVFENRDGGYVTVGRDGSIEVLPDDA